MQSTFVIDSHQIIGATTHIYILQPKLLLQKKSLHYLLCTQKPILIIKQTMKRNVTANTWHQYGNWIAGTHCSNTHRVCKTMLQSSGNGFSFNCMHPELTVVWNWIIPSITLNNKEYIDLYSCFFVKKKNSQTTNGVNCNTYLNLYSTLFTSGKFICRVGLQQQLKR